MSSRCRLARLLSGLVVGVEFVENDASEAVESSTTRVPVARAERSASRSTMRPSADCTTLTLHSGTHHPTADLNQLPIRPIHAPTIAT